VKRSRTVLPAIGIALVAGLGLAGCSTGGAEGDAAACAPAGSVSKSLEVSGEPGAELQLKTKTPITVETLERSVLTEGKGDAIEKGGVATATMTLFNGKTGEILTSEEASFVNDPEKFAPWMVDTLKCTTAGERVASVIPAVDMFGPGGAAQYGFADVADTDAMVLVFDVKKVDPAPPAAKPALPRAEGAAKDAPAGFPTVVLAEDGSPTITIPKDAKAPEKLEIATVIEGSGAVVQPGDNVKVHYTGVIWRTGEVFDSSWKNGAPVDFGTNGVIGGFQQALEGMKVGSQIISVVPAEDGGYGAAGLEGKGFKSDDVMVFVLDILAIN
jgi:peptidylprolyl isomerase